MPSSPEKKSYSVSELKGLPFIGMLIPCIKDPLNFIENSAQRYGDIISFTSMGQKVAQLNHPDLIRYVLIENHKNYKKNAAYIRFESVGGQGLLTSHGDKWKRDRQKIQPLFNRELIAGFHYEIANEISEKLKKKWLTLTTAGPAEVNIIREMATITTEVIIKIAFGRDIDSETVKSIHHSYEILIDYLKNIRVFPRVDSRKLFCMPSYFKFKRALDYVDAFVSKLTMEYRSGSSRDRRNMLALLLDAQKNDPDHFNDREIRDQCVTMIFAGFETTSLTLQWMWYALDGRPDIQESLRRDITNAAPCTATPDSHNMTFESVSKMDYLAALFRETLRLYPSFWVTGREPIEDDYLGDFKLAKGTIVVLPQFAMHRHPRYWENPDECIPERFLPLNEVHFDEGIYFPFTHGPRKCIGSVFSEMEAKTIMAKLVPFFNVEVLNKENNPLYPGVSLKLKHPLMARISRAEV
jgi:cytochrome P450